MNVILIPLISKQSIFYWLYITSEKGANTVCRNNNSNGSAECIVVAMFLIVCNFILSPVCSSDFSCCTH